MEGSVNLQLSAKSVGVFEAFYNSVKVRPAQVSISSENLCLLSQIISFLGGSQVALDSMQITESREMLNVII